MQRPGSEDPHRRELNVIYLFRNLQKKEVFPTKGMGNLETNATFLPHYLPTVKLRDIEQELGTHEG